MLNYERASSFFDDMKRHVNSYRRYSHWSEKQCIFVHVPKAAGTSINRALYGRTLGHYRAVDLRQRFPKLFERCFVFAFVRNPWDRVLSAYRFARLGRTDAMGIRNPRQYQIPQFESFERFLFEWLVYQDLSKIDLVFRPQLSFIADSDGREIIQFLGRVESLATDIEFVESRLRRSLHIDHENRTGTGESYRGAYTSNSMIDIVGDVYAQDILHFAYSY